MSRTQRIALRRLDFIPDLSGALYVPDFETLLVADLHLEKASSLARRGVHLPPYDTRETLAQLAAAIAATFARAADFPGRQFSRRRCARSASMRADVAAAQRASPSAIATQSGSPAITILHRRSKSAAASPQEVVLGPVMLRHAPSAPGPDGVRDRRPPASRRCGVAARTGWCAANVSSAMTAVW